MRSLCPGSPRTLVAKSQTKGKAINFRVRWHGHHLLGVMTYASRRKDPGAYTKRPRRGDNSDNDDDADREVGSVGQLYGIAEFGATDDTDPDTAAIAEFVRAKQLAAMRRSRLNVAADAAAAVRSRDADLNEYLAAQGLGSISQFRELADQEAQRTMAELKEADLASLEVQIAAEGGNLEADWAALESARSTTGLAKSSPGVRGSSSRGAQLPDNTLLAPPSNPRVERLRAQSRPQQMRRKRRLFNPVDGDGSLYDDPPSGSSSDDDGVAAYDYRPPSSSPGAGALLRRPTAAAPGVPPVSGALQRTPPAPPPVNPFLSLPKRPGDSLDSLYDVDAILDRMIDNDVVAVRQQQQLRAAAADDDDDDRYDDDGYDVYGNRRPGAVDPAAVNDEYGDRMLRALRGALTEESERGAAESLVGRPERRPQVAAGGSRGPQASAVGAAAAAAAASKDASRLTRLSAAAPVDDYDALAELLESVGGELEAMGGVSGGLDDDGDDDGNEPRVGPAAASPTSSSSKRPLTTTELLRSQTPPPGGSGAAELLLGRPTTTTAAAGSSRGSSGGLQGSRSSASSAASSSSSDAKGRRQVVRGAFADGDAQLLEELMSGDAFLADSDMDMAAAGTRQQQPFGQWLVGVENEDEDWSRPPAPQEPRLPSLESKPTPRGRMAMGSSSSSASSSRGAASGRGKDKDVAFPTSATSSLPSLAWARRDQEELLRDDWDAALYGLDESFRGLDAAGGSGDGRGSGLGADWQLSLGSFQRPVGSGAASGAESWPPLLARPSKQAAAGAGAGGGVAAAAGRGSTGGGGGAGTAAGKAVDGGFRAGAAGLGAKDLEEMLRGLEEFDGTEPDAGFEKLKNVEWDSDPVAGRSAAAAPAAIVLASRPMRGAGSGGGSSGGSQPIAASAGGQKSAAAAAGSSKLPSEKQVVEAAEIKTAAAVAVAQSPPPRAAAEVIAAAPAPAPASPLVGSASSAATPPPQPSSTPSAGRGPSTSTAGSGSSAAARGGSYKAALATLADPTRAAALARLEGKPQLSSPPPRQSGIKSRISNSSKPSAGNMSLSDAKPPPQLRHQPTVVSVTSSLGADNMNPAVATSVEAPAAPAPAAAAAAAAGTPVAAVLEAKEATTQASMEAVAAAAAGDDAPAAKSQQELAAAAAAAAAVLRDTGKGGSGRALRRLRPALVDSLISAPAAAVAAVPPTRPAAETAAPAATAASTAPPLRPLDTTKGPTAASLAASAAGKSTNPTAVVAAVAEAGSGLMPKPRTVARLAPVRSWRPGRAPLPGGLDLDSTHPAAAPDRTSANKADTAATAAVAAALVDRPGTSRTAPRYPGLRLWDPFLRLDAPLASRPAAAAAAGGGGGSTAATTAEPATGGRDLSPSSSRSTLPPQPPLSFSDRLRRVRLMVLRGELLEGFIHAEAADICKHQGVAAFFPKLAQLGVAQPVWIAADDLLPWRLRGGGPRPQAKSTLADEELVSELHGNRRGPREDEDESGVASREGDSAAEAAAAAAASSRSRKPKRSKKIWAAVTSVGAFADEAHLSGVWTTAEGAAEGGVAAAAAARLHSMANGSGGGGAPGAVPPDLAVQAVEVLLPDKRRWASLPQSIRRQLLDLNRGRVVYAEVIAITERGAYCEVKMGAPALPPAVAESQADAARTELRETGPPYGGLPKPGTATAATAAAAAEAAAAVVAAAASSEDVVDAADAAIEAAADGEELGDPGPVLFSQLCFLPAECMAGRKAAEWVEDVRQVKSRRIRALTRTPYGVVLHSARSLAPEWDESERKPIIMRRGDLVEGRLQGSIIVPVPLVMGIISQVPHRTSPALLEALDLAAGPGADGASASFASARAAPAVTATAAAAAVGTTETVGCEEVPVGGWLTGLSGGPPSTITTTASTLTTMIAAKPTAGDAAATTNAKLAAVTAACREAASNGAATTVDPITTRVVAILEAVAPASAGGSRTSGNDDVWGPGGAPEDGGAGGLGLRPAVLALDVLEVTQRLGLGGGDRAGALLGLPLCRGAAPAVAIIRPENTKQVYRVVTASSHGLNPPPDGPGRSHGEPPEGGDSDLGLDISSRLASLKLSRPTGHSIAPSSPPAASPALLRQMSFARTGPAASRPPQSRPRPSMKRSQRAPPDTPMAVADHGGDVAGGDDSFWSWDTNLKLDAPSSSRSAAAAAAATSTSDAASIAAEGVASRAATGTDISPSSSITSRRFPAARTTSFEDRLRRVRLMVMRGELLEGHLRGSYDTSRHALAADFPALAKLGVAQPVWIPAEGLLNWRKDRMTTEDGAAADEPAEQGQGGGTGVGAGGGEEEEGEEKEEKETMAVGGVQSKGSQSSSASLGVRHPTKRIWVAVTSVRAAATATDLEPSQQAQGQDQDQGAVSSGGARMVALVVAKTRDDDDDDGTAASGPGAAPPRPGVELDQTVPADLAVQLVEAMPPWSQRWGSGFTGSRRQVIASNHGRKVITHVLAITERGAYCELQLEAPRRPGDRPKDLVQRPPAAAAAAVAEVPAAAAPKGPDSSEPSGSTTAAAAEPRTRFSGYHSAAAAASEGTDRGPLADGMMAHAQLAFLPRESLAAPLAASWDDMVTIDKELRARAVARSAGDAVLLADISARRRFYSWSERLRLGDVLEALLDFSVIYMPLSTVLVMAILRQVPHRTSPALLRALDMAMGPGANLGTGTQAGVADATAQGSAAAPPHRTTTTAADATADAAVVTPAPAGGGGTAAGGGGAAAAATAPTGVLSTAAGNAGATRPAEVPSPDVYSPGRVPVLHAAVMMPCDGLLVGNQLGKADGELAQELAGCAGELVR